jgi:hypothetical protein
MCYFIISDDQGRMLHSPQDDVVGNAIESEVSGRLVNCGDALGRDEFPIPRCISDIACNYDADPSDWKKLQGYKSARRTSHMTTFFGQFVTFDLVSTKTNVSSPPNLIPADDDQFNRESARIDANQTVFRFARSAFDQAKPGDRPGIGESTAFLDLNQLYGNDEETADKIRDKRGGRGKLRIREDGFPLLNETSNRYVVGAASSRSRNMFTMAVHVIWIREHNRRCDELWKIYGGNWSDEDYFRAAVMRFLNGNSGCF